MKAEELSVFENTILPSVPEAFLKHHVAVDHHIEWKMEALPAVWGLEEWISLSGKIWMCLITHSLKHREGKRRKTSILAPPREQEQERKRERERERHTHTQTRTLPNPGGIGKSDQVILTSPFLLCFFFLQGWDRTLYSSVTQSLQVGLDMSVAETCLCMC